MAVTRVSTGNVGAVGASASAITAAIGVAVSVGDLIVVSGASNGTHATNGMAASDSKNGSYTTLLEVQGGNASSRWQQSFWKIATSALLTTDLVSFTPYAASTVNGFSVDVYRGLAGTIDKAVVGTSGPTGLSAAMTGLATAATAGSLVLSLVQVGSGTMTAPSPFVAGSYITTGPSLGIANVLSASGASTYSGTWTWGTSNSSSMQVVSFTAGAAAPALPASLIMQTRRAF